MYNQFHNTLLNLPYVGDSFEHINKAFSPIPLSTDLQPIYDVLFPDKSNREYKRLLTNAYLKLIEASGLSYAVTDLDNRITYDLNTDEFFKINRHSNPKLSNSLYPIFIHGNYFPHEAIFEDEFLIQQFGFSNSISIYSKEYKAYIKGNATYSAPGGSALTTLTFTNNVSQKIDMGRFGFNFQIQTDGHFGDTNNKTWEFIISGANDFEFLPLYNRLKSTELANYMLKLKPRKDTTKFEAIWRSHFNPVYQLAAFIICFVYRI